jgi:AraC-like DNA-binding protein
MNRLSHYIDSQLVSLSRFDHFSCEPHRDPPEEIAPDHSISFLERGDFSLRVARREWRMSPRTIFVTSPGMVFRVRHAEEFPQDVTFIVAYKVGFSEGLAGVEVGGAHLPPALPLTNRLAYLYTLLKRVSQRHADVMMAETLAGELLAAVTRGVTAGERRLYERQQLAWYVERVEAARSLMESEYSSHHTLASLARFTGMSPFHFARVFSELAGTPPHRYLMRVRLARASERLRDGESVTETCYASGFSNLSHFIRVFKRSFGVSPSRYSRQGKKPVSSH